MPTMVSTIPACLDALVALATRVLPSGVQVSDGQPFALALDMVCIGFTGVPGESSVLSTRTREQMAPDPDRESYDVISLASSLLGKPDAAPVRDRVFGWVDLIARALALDPTMGETVARALVSVASLAEVQTEDGASAVVQFTIHVDAWTR